MALRACAESADEQSVPMSFLDVLDAEPVRESAGRSIRFDSLRALSFSLMVANNFSDRAHRGSDGLGTTSRDHCPVGVIGVIGVTWSQAA